MPALRRLKPSRRKLAPHLLVFLLSLTLAVVAAAGGAREPEENGGRRRRHRQQMLPKAKLLQKSGRRMEKTTATGTMNGRLPVRKPHDCRRPFYRRRRSSGCSGTA